MADTTPSQDLIDAITSSRDAYFGHRGHLQRTAESERLFAEAFTLGADFALDAPQPNAAPAATVYTMEALVPGGGVKHHAHLHVALPAGTKLYAAPQPNAALADGWKRKPLTLAQMEAGRESIFSTSNPFCPCDSKTFRKVAEWVERHHRIEAAPPTLNASKGRQP